MTADFSRDRIDLAREADFRLGAIDVRPSTRQVEADGGAETLEPRIMQVLVALARRRGQVVSRDELIETCWEGRIVGDDALNRCISKVRKLGAANGDFRLTTIPRVGYRMDVAEAASAPVGERGDAPSLAVLPFVNRSDLPEDEVFADGMVEDVIDALSQYPHLRVLGSMVTAGLRGAALDLAQVGKQFGVDYLLEGNVRRAGSDLRVGAQLIDARTGTVLWSGRFERPLSQLAQLQEELVVDLAGSLNMQIHTVEMQRALKKPGDITAWEAVNRAMAAQRQVDPMSLTRAIEEAERAVAIDPDYPLAQGMLAVTLGTAYMLSSPDDPIEAGRIRAIAEKAMALGQDIPFVMVNGASALTCIGLPELALPPLRAVLQRKPELGPVHYVLAQTYCVLNEPEKALFHLGIAARLTPVPYMLAYIKDYQANAMIRLGCWGEAEALLDEVRAMSPRYPFAHITKAVLLWLHQRREEARAVFAPLRESGLLQIGQLLLVYGRVYARAGAREDILAAIRELWAESGTA